MNFSTALARLAAQILLGMAAFLWLAIAFLDPNRGPLQIGIGIGGALALLALLRLGKGGKWVPPVATIGLIAPIGLLAHANGASPWIWILWGLIALGTERWVRDGHRGAA